MAIKQLKQSASEGSRHAESLIEITERLSQLMETEVELVRGRRARDIAAMQTDKESLATIYQRMVSDLQQNPAALDGLDEQRRSLLKRAAARLEDAATSNAIVLRSALEANRQLMEAIASAIRERGTENVPYAANGRRAHGGDRRDRRNLTVAYNDTL